MQINYFFLTQNSAGKAHSGKSKINLKIDSIITRGIEWSLRACENGVLFCEYEAVVKNCLCEQRAL